MRDGRVKTLGAVSAFGLDEARRGAAVIRETGEPPPLVAPETEAPAEPETPAEAGTTVTKLWETNSEAAYLLSRSPDFRRGLTSTMKVHVIPAFGDRPPSTLTRKELREAVNALIADGRGGAARGLLNRLRFLLNFAIEEELIEARGIRHAITIGVDRIRKEPALDHQQSASDVTAGTSVTVSRTDSASSLLEEGRDEFIDRPRLRLPQPATHPEP